MLVCETFDFTTITAREGPVILKWDKQYLRHTYNREEGLIPVWLADMDFRSPLHHPIVNPCLAYKH